MDPETLPPNAIILPILAFPAWILCIPPLVWHFSQRNIAAWSLIAWSILGNFFNSINPLIWPRENILEWYGGAGLCDIEARVLVGYSVALAACVTMIIRKLANVMDTRNIVVAPSHGSRIREKVFEGLVCWGYPALLMLVYFIVQPIRYIIYQIGGCGPAYDASWVSIVLSLMWPLITIGFASYFAGLLIYRLFRYRREFHRLLSARNTTQSRFIRLFLMSVLVIIAYLPYNFYMLWWHSSQVVEVYSWSRVHNAKTWNTVIKVPMGGAVRFDKWGQVATGYVAFIVFGTGADAYNTYKRMLCAIGLGRVFPGLLVVSESGSSTPTSARFTRSWASTYADKAKTFFSKSSSVTEMSLPGTTGTGSTVEPTSPTTTGSASIWCHAVSTNEPIIEQSTTNSSSAPTQNTRSFFARLLPRRNCPNRSLPVAAPRSSCEAVEPEKQHTEPHAIGVYSHAWAAERPTAARNAEVDGVHVVHEVWQENGQRRDVESKNNSFDTV
ncbi:STE3-domain-containing protein [Aaosphaeria arxii CBS 175.79]|uniref:STE3-domain-containing protein n=1 Tax=Aaosphaeria arxii CBS 175.79 TaxID=1450172 RepID=A0A6A5XIK6_9PLEO|nr:STE3-domain-containing protein [Aaosphaeria arxii CBS 175.79]KAF2012661.1 STE3-domain-containing protein [Aaosphaeria arxii CBS 175.79]